MLKTKLLMAICLILALAVSSQSQDFKFAPKGDPAVFKKKFKD
jgi:hypothetical protein